MKLFICLFSLTLCALVSSQTKTSSKKKSETSQIGNKTRTHQRHARQIGYGAAGSGLTSQLSGISSGYGYGYNNAVGLSGLGQNAGAGTVIAPLIGGFVGGVGGVGYPGYYGGNGIGAYGGNGIGAYGGGVGGGAGWGNGVNTAGLSGGSGWGSGGMAAPAVGQAVLPVASAVIPITGVVSGGAYGRSDDAVAPSNAQLAGSTGISPVQQTSQGLSGQAPFSPTNTNQMQG